MVFGIPTNMARSMRINGDLVLYTTSTCKRCVKLSDFLTKLGVQHTKIVIDEDGDAEAEALMLGICAVPTLKKGDEILKPRSIFTGDDRLIEEKVREFLNDRPANEKTG
jgi:glutaredoxin